MKHRVISVLGAAAVALGAPLLAAAPASAADGPPVVGCTTGSSCMVELNYDVTYSGSTGGSNGVVVTPPPCIGVPAGDAHSGSQAIISLYGATAPAPTDGGSPPADTASATPTASTTSPSSNLTAVELQIFNQAEQLVNSNPITPGEWYQITGNPYASSAAQQKCNNLPPYIWVPGGQRLVVKGVNIPARTLAELAYSQLTTAVLGTVTLDPKGASDTNLPTFVDAAIAPAQAGAAGGGLLGVTGPGTKSGVGKPYVWATAATPDGTAATVWAWVTGFTISPDNSASNSSNWKVSDDQQTCTQAQAGPNVGEFMLGSRESSRERAQTGVNTPIDCGVTYTAPGTYALTVSVDWDACWARGEPETAGTVGPPLTCKPVPGAQALAPSTSQPVQVNVREIQSVNG